MTKRIKYAPEVQDKLKAIKFVTPAIDKKGGIFKQHCIIKNDKIIVWNGIILACHPFISGINACPNLEQFESALKECTQETYSLTTNESETAVTVSCDKFYADVPTLTDIELPSAEPTIAGIPLTPEQSEMFLYSLEVAYKTMIASATDVHLGSVHIENGLSTAMNKSTIVQVCHNVNFGTPIIIPREFVNCLIKAKKPIKELLRSAHTLTCIFEDDTLYMTMLYEFGWPEINPIVSDMVKPSECFSLPADFEDHIKNVKKSACDKRLHFEAGKVKTYNTDPEKQTQIDLDLGVPADVKGHVQIAEMVKIAKLAKKARVTFKEDGYRFEFYGNSLRGFTFDELTES